MKPHTPLWSILLLSLTIQKLCPFTKNLAWISPVIRATFIWLVTLSASVYAAETLPVESWYGKTPQELVQLSPNLSKAKPGEMFELENWKGWRGVMCSFNARGRLVGLSFTPTKPLNEVEAKRIVEEDFKIKLGKQYEKRPPALIAFRDMPGKIRTVNFQFVDMKTDKRIGEIGIFYSLGWSQ